MSHEEALAALRKSRAENADYRKKQSRLDELEAAAKAADDAKLDVAEKAAKQLAEKTAAYDTLHQRYVALLVAREAEKLGFHDGSDAYLHIQGDVQLDADGVPTNAKELLATLGKEKSYLLRGDPTTPSTPKPPMSPSNPGRASSATPTLADVNSGKFSLQEIANMWGDGTMRKLLDEANR
jgi:hypothetical protein